MTPIFKDCVFINEEHQGSAAALLATVAHELRAAGLPIPPSLATWEEDMRHLSELRQRKEVIATDTQSDQQHDPYKSMRHYRQTVGIAWIVGACAMACIIYGVLASYLDLPAPWR